MATLFLFRRRPDAILVLPRGYRSPRLPGSLSELALADHSGMMRPPPFFRRRFPDKTFVFVLACSPRQRFVRGPPRLWPPAADSVLLGGATAAFVPTGRRDFVVVVGGGGGVAPRPCGFNDFGDPDSRGWGREGRDRERREGDSQRGTVREGEGERFLRLSE